MRINDITGGDGRFGTPDPSSGTVWRCRKLDKYAYTNGDPVILMSYGLVGICPPDPPAGFHP